MLQRIRQRTRPAAFLLFDGVRSSASSRFRISARTASPVYRTNSSTPHWMQFSVAMSLSIEKRSFLQFISWSSIMRL